MLELLATMMDVEKLLLSYAPSRMHEADYDLGRIRRLMDHIGNPQNELRIIHVAGTSGKTSTAYYVRALLESAGKSTGLTVSPHIETMCERLQLAGKPVTGSAFVRYFQEYYSHIKDYPERPTYFEHMTAFAYWVFAREQVDYAVVEVGLGGRYDATNIVNRSDKVCVINSIGYDHTEILGETLTEIATEKAGIIQPGNTVFTVEQELEGWAVIQRVADENQAKLNVIRPKIDHGLPAPPFQQHNFALALGAVSYVAKRDGFVLPDDHKKVLSGVLVPGRYETYRVAGKTVIVDGAHNPQKLAALIATLRERAVTPAVVVAAFADAPDYKINECTRLLVGYADHCIFTQFVLQRDVLRRSVGLATIEKAVSGEVDTSYEVEENPEVALQKAIARKEQFIIVTGSLYLGALLRSHIKSLAAS